MAGVTVFYACGTDHAAKCGLYSGMGNIGVVVVPRAGEKPEGENPGNRVYVGQAAAGEVATFSSTKVRQAIAKKDAAYIEKTMAKEAAQLILKPTLVQKSTFAGDFKQLGVN